MDQANTYGRIPPRGVDALVAAPSPEAGRAAQPCPGRC